MPKPRKTQISLGSTSFYHCTPRCVRRACLCGGDPVSGQSYEHRREWVKAASQLMRGFLGTFTSLTLLSRLAQIRSRTAETESNCVVLTLIEWQESASGFLDTITNEDSHELHPDGTLSTRLISMATASATWPTSLR